ncbi:hypothetical protein LIER_01711 [Lithospermum erythrorhizon]|uniref:GATA-type domain-containing protein n=1 Tax=Lithospermum erythrorhizon TaxID=34254 RepID=A0AAV3NPB7_LITER
MEYNNGWFNNNATTENQSVGLDLTLRIGQPDNKINQQEESRVQIDNVNNSMQYGSMNVGQNNYLYQGHIYYVSQGRQFNYQNQQNIAYVNQTQSNYVNQQPWMNFSSSMIPTSNLMTTTRVTRNNSTQAFDHFPSFIAQPMSQVRTCNACQTTTTPMWRRGPNGPHTLCNACGLRHARTVKKEN